MNSNRFQFVPRERISGNVGAIDFGRTLSCIMRSPTHALFWSAGGTYWSGINRSRYAESQLSAYCRPRPEMVARHGPGYRASGADGDYINIGTSGGRLDRVPAYERLSTADWQKLAKYFRDDFEGEILQAIENKQTLLIEGGGAPFAPFIVRHRIFKL